MPELGGTQAGRRWVHHRGGDAAVTYAAHDGRSPVLPAAKYRGSTVRLVGAGGCAALAFGMAGAAGAVSAPAQARVTATLLTSHVAAGWGYNAQGQLGDHGQQIAVWRHQGRQ
jgi:hypothetical protein